MFFFYLSGVWVLDLNSFLRPVVFGVPTWLSCLRIPMPGLFMKYLNYIETLFLSRFCVKETNVNIMEDSPRSLKTSTFMTYSELTCVKVLGSVWNTFCF